MAHTFYFWASVSFLMAVVWIVFGKERITGEYQRRIESQVGSPLRVILRYPELWIMGLGMLGSMVGNTSFQLFWPTLAEDKLGIAPSVIGLTLGLGVIAASPADLLVNAVPTLVRHQPLILGLGGLVVTSMYIGLLYAESTLLVLVLGVLMGAAHAYFPVLMIMVFQMPNISPREVGVGLAFMETCIWMGGATGPLIVGYVEAATGDLRFAIMLTSFTPLILLISAALFVARRWSTRSLQST